MSALADQRCLNHAGREAVARCPSCRDFFCRECVTEHEGRVLCAGCLAKLAKQRDARRLRTSLFRPLLAAVSLALVWIVFFALGSALLLLPDSFHDGTIWGTGRPAIVQADAP